MSAPTAQLWWQEQGITRLVAGVFEGGGAKGLLYRGALEAMVESDDRPCWFSGVAGASAGAITATLIAAGLKPAHVADEAAKALGALRKPTLLSGSLRLRNGASYLDQDGLADWLAGLLEVQVGALSTGKWGAGVTFNELYGLTRIELDVVAVDLKRQRLVVFNYKLTPRCRVAEAVVASTAIPLAFEWQPLFLPGSPFGIIVDGGVMANFPTFVFKDPSFREWACLPEHPSSVPVLGFLLDERDRADDRKPGVYREGTFWPPVSQLGALVKSLPQSEESELPAEFEPRRSKFRPRPEKPSIATRLAQLLGRALWISLWPVWKLLLDWAPKLLLLNSSEMEANWPQPKYPAIARLLRWFDRILAGARPPGFLLGGFLAATLCLGVGAYFVAWRPLVGHIGDVINGDVSPWGAVLGLIFLVLWSLVPIYAWMVLSIVFFVGWLMHRTLRMTGHGLVKTYLQGSAAPIWAGAEPHDHVVRLPVPPGMTTLDVGLDDEALEVAVEEARAATRAELRELEFKTG
jgi:predicted acylesterase/phospholipase RssA